MKSNRFIIICGPDCCGKDTQIALLKDKICDRPTHVIHVKPPKRFSNDIKPYMQEYFMDMFSLIYEASFKRRNLIFNRAHIGDYVYGPMYRKYDANYIFDLIENEWVDCDFFENIRLITLIDTPEVLLSREDGDSHSIDLEDKKEEIKRFIEATNKSKIKHIIIDSNGKTSLEIHEEICIFLDDVI